MREEIVYRVCSDTMLSANANSSVILLLSKQIVSVREEVDYRMGDVMLLGETSKNYCFGGCALQSGLPSPPPVVVKVPLLCLESPDTEK